MCVDETLTAILCDSALITASFHASSGAGVGGRATYPGENAAQLVTLAREPAGRYCVERGVDQTLPRRTSVIVVECLKPTTLGSGQVVYQDCMPVDENSKRMAAAGR
jgi:hypothetical protein